MNVVALFCLGLIMVIFQTSVFRFFGISHLKVSLVLSVIIYAAFYLEETRGLILSFLLGYAVDVFSGGQKGITPVVMVGLCLVGQWMRKGILVDGKLALGMVAFACGVMQGISWIAIDAVVEAKTFSREIPFFHIIIQSVLLGLVSPFIVKVTAPINRLATTGWRRP
jgi:rod shape-determining protein MreD